MMYSEFYERTGIEVSMEEYHIIEESYYEFDGNKDEFCKAWKKDYKSGRWAKEYRLRKALEDQKAEYEKKLAEQEETLDFYRIQYCKMRGDAKKMREALEKVQALARWMETA